MSDKNNPTIKQRMTKLSEIVTWFESEDFDLEDAVDKFAEAERLANEIEKDLAKLKNKVDVIKKRFDT